ncbi:stromelysin-3-like [Glandiceps talaboti]
MANITLSTSVLIGCLCHMVLATVDPMVYLSRFGYMEKRQPSKSDIIESVMNFQRMANLEMTGHLDTETIQMMQAPRCGVDDMVGSAIMGTDHSNSRTSAFMPRSKRYALGGSKWDKTKLTFRLLNSSPDLTVDEVRRALYRAFRHWSDVTPLTFTEISSGEADIMIKFGTYEHGDGPYAAFDGQGGILAHAYFPKDGDLHFDDDEYFTVGKSHNRLSIDLDFTATHEIGHSLGLGHSDVRGAIMQPFYPGYQSGLKLHRDDVAGIQRLYGRKEDERPMATSSPDDQHTPPPKPDKGNGDGDGDEDDGDVPDTCATDFDAVFNDADGNTYAIKTKHIWKITSDGVAEGYPKKLHDEFRGLPGNINTGFTAPNGRTYFFKGTRYWRFYKHQLEPGYPKEITGMGAPRNPDAAFVWSGDGKIYIFKGSRYYIWSDYYERVIPGGVREIRKHWNGVPTRVDAAFRWMDGMTYFFKGDKYYLYDDMRMRVANGYPKSKAADWLGCM